MFSRVPKQMASQHTGGVQMRSVNQRPNLLNLTQDAWLFT